MSASTATVALVHGAFADASSWNGVIERLQAQGVPVIAAANPLRGIASDSAYIAAVCNDTPGPVVAVGHSYGGAIITNAATQADNVVGLVFVAAFAPEEGETLGAATGDSKDSVLNSTLTPHPYPTPDGGDPAVEFAIDPAKLRDAFATDLPAEQTKLVAATQRPVAELAFSQPNGAPAWKRLPSCAVLATGDKAAGTDIGPEAPCVRHKHPGEEIIYAGGLARVPHRRQAADSGTTPARPCSSRPKRFTR